MADIETNVKVNIDTSDALAQLKLLQQQISAFQQAMRKAGADNAAAARAMQQNLVNSINATGKFQANIQTIQTSAERFTTALEKNKLTMGEYFRYAGGASKTFGKLFKSEFETINQVALDRVKTIQTQYIKLGRDASGAMKAISVRPLALDLNDLGTKTQIAAQRQALFNQLMKQGSTQLLNFGKNTQWAGRQLMVGFTVPLTMAGSAAAKAYMQIEQASVKFKRVYGDMQTTAEEANKMAKAVQGLATQFTQYGVAVADTMDMAANAAAMGKTGSDLLAQVNEAAKLSVLGGVDQNKALQTTISLTNAFGTAADKLSGKVNFLNAVENQTVLSIEDLTTAIPKAAPVVKQLGGSVEDLAFFMTAMKEGGINASEGANALKSGLASMINPTKQASDFLAGFGINVKSIVNQDKGNVKQTVIDMAKAFDTLDPLNRSRAIEMMFGKFQFSRISTLFKNVIDQGSQANKVAGLANSTAEELAILSERELKKISDSPMYKFQKSIEEMKAKLAPVGEAFLKAVTPIINFVSKILDGFNNLSEGSKKFITILVTAVAGIGPLLLMSFGLISNGIANIMKLFTNLKSFLNRTGNRTNILGEQTQYMNTEQLKGAAIASSLDQAHAKLRQTFTSETTAINDLTTAYRNAIQAQQAFAGVPNVPVGNPNATPANTPTPSPKKYATGVSMVPGPNGAGDIVPALLSPGEAVIPAASAKKYAPVIRGMIAGNLPGFETGTAGAGMRQSIYGPLTQKQTEGLGRTGLQLKEISDEVMAGPYGNVPPTDFGTQISPTSGHSFPAFEVGGIYQKPDGTKVFVKPQMNLASALAEVRGTEIARGAHGLVSPQQQIRVMMDPTDPDHKRRFIVLESPLDERLANVPKTFSNKDYFTQLVASLLRGDKDLGIGNLGGNVLADVGTAGVFQRASGKRELGAKINSMEEQAIINLLGVKGGAKRFFAEATSEQVSKMTPAQYDAAMKAEIQRVIPKLQSTIAGFGPMSPEEKAAYAEMQQRLEAGLGVDWGKYQVMHSAVKPKLFNGGTTGDAALDAKLATLSTAQLGQLLVGGIQETHAFGGLDPKDPKIQAELKRVYKNSTPEDFTNFEVLSNLTMTMPGKLNQQIKEANGGMPGSLFAEIYNSFFGKLAKTARMAGVKDLSQSQQLENMIGQRLSALPLIKDKIFAKNVEDFLSNKSGENSPLGGAAELIWARSNQVGTVRSKFERGVGESNHDLILGMLRRNEIGFNATASSLDTPFGARLGRWALDSFGSDGASATPKEKEIRRRAQEAYRAWAAAGNYSGNMPTAPQDLLPDKNGNFGPQSEGTKFKPIKFKTNSDRPGAFSTKGQPAYDSTAKEFSNEGLFGIVAGSLSTLMGNGYIDPTAAKKFGIPGFALGTENVGGVSKVKPKASVFDIDDTLLDLSSFMPAHQAANEKLPVEQRTKWHKEVAKNPQPIPAGIAALKAAQARGNKIILMTARPDSYDPHTIETLTKLGIDMKGIKLVSRRDKDYRKPWQMKYDKTSAFMKYYDIEEFYDDMPETRGAISLLNIPTYDPLKLANGVFSVPGPKGAGDVVPAMLSPGEAVIPADKAQQHRGLISQMIKGSLPGFANGTIVPGYSSGTGDVSGFPLEKYSETNPLPVVLMEDKSKGTEIPDLSGKESGGGETGGEGDTTGTTKTPNKFMSGLESAKTKLFTQGAGTAKVGKYVRGAAVAAGIAATMPGPIGDIGKAAVGPIGAAASAMSMIPGPAGMVVGALMALVTIGIQLNTALTEARKKTVDFVESIGTGNKAMMKFENFAKSVSASEIMDRKRAEAFSPYQIKPGKQTFGSSYMQTEDGKALVKVISEAQSKGGNAEAQRALTEQLSAAVSSGVLKADQARSIAGNVGAQMGNQTLGIGAASTLLNIYGPNGENLAKEPLKLRLQVAKDSEVQLAKSIDNMQQHSLMNAEEGLKTAGQMVQTQFVIPMTAASGKGNIFKSLVEGNSIAVTAKLWTTMWGRIEQANTSAAAFAAQAGNALEVQKQMLDGLDLEYQKRIEIAKAQGNSILAADLAIQKEKDKQKLLDENTKTVDAIVNASNAADSGPLSALGVGWWGQQDAIKETANNAVTEKFKGTGQDIQAKMALQNIDQMQGNFGQQTLLKQEVSSGQIGLSQIDTIKNLYGGSQAGMDELTKMISQKGIQVDQALQVAQMFSNIEDQKKFMLTFSAQTDSGKSQELIDAMTLVSKNQSNINLNFLMTYFQKNKGDALKIKQDMDAIGRYKGKLNVDVIAKAKYIGKDEMALLKADTSYFSHLDKEQQITYITSIKTTTALKGTKEFKQASQAYMKENPGKTAEDYQKAVARSVTAANVDSSKVPGGDKKGGSGGPPAASFLDQYVNSIRDASGWQQKLTIGFADSMKAMRRWSKDALNSGAGLAQRLHAYGADANFIQAVLGGDQKDIDKIIDRATGKLTKAGKDAIRIAKQVEDAKIGMAYVTSSESERAGKDNELYNSGLDVIAGKEKKINEKYDARVKALDEIGKAQEKNNQLQQNTMDLADALSKGDIAAAARVALKAKQDSQKAALDDAKNSLENARKAELADITVTILGHTETRQSLEAKIEENTAKIAANKLLELDRQVGIGKNAVIAADAAQRLLEANKKISVLPTPYNPTYGTGDGSSSTTSETSTPTDALPMLGADNAAADAKKKKDPNFWSNLFPNIGDWLAQQWKALSTWFSDITNPKKIGEFVGNMWNGIKDIGSWLTEQANKIGNWFATTFSGENIGKMVGNLWNGIQGINKWLGDQALKVWKWITGLPDKMTKWAKDFWENGIPAIGHWFETTTKKIADWVVSLPQQAMDAIKNAGKSIADWWGAFVGGFNSTQDDKTKKKAEGGMISRYANGGSVVPKYFEFGGFTKQGTDTIPAMLTPGEFVMKKSAVESIGAQELARMNYAGKDAMSGGDSVYNYSITVNANSSDSSDIADKVLQEIKRIDSQRIRSIG